MIGARLECYDRGTQREVRAVPNSNRSQVTQLLIDWRRGDARALDRLLPIVYEEMRQLAQGYMRRERADHTLQATALVHEAYSRLVGMEIDWQDRVHFFAVAARTMRRILVDHARKHKRRPGGWKRETLNESLLVGDSPNIDLVALDEALDRLAAFDERKSKAIELHYFAGLKHTEVAEALSVSPATVDRDLRMAKAWLYKELKA